MYSQNIQTVKNNAVRENVSPAKLEEMETLEEKIAQISRSIVQQAIDCGDLDKKHQDKVSTIVFGCWSMHYGALLLDHSDIPLEDLGFSSVVQMLWDNANTYLDGYQWQPLSNTFDKQSLFKKISSALDVEKSSC